MADVTHSNLTGAIAIHPAAYVQSSDPGAVGAAKFWVDTTTTPSLFKKRNAGNSAWDTVGYVDTLTTRGDLPYRGASSTGRLALGAVGTHPTSDGTDLVYNNVVNAGANGQTLAVLSLTELTTIAAAATTVTTIQIPAGAIVLAVSVRVTVVIPTAATFTVIGNTTTTVFQTAAVAVAANSTDPGTAAGAFYNAAAQTVRITPNLTPADNSGRVRVTIFYLASVPPTS